jgi:hypothetical protein
MVFGSAATMSTKPKTLRERSQRVRGKLNAEKACAIIQRAFDGASRKLLAIEYGVSLDVVNKVIKGRSWVAETVELRRELIRQMNRIASSR